MPEPDPTDGPDRLEATVLDALRHNLMDPELFRAFCAEYVAEMNRARGNDTARRAQLEKELGKD